MKKLILFLSIFCALQSFGQSPVATGDILFIVPVSAQRVYVSDSVQIYATLTSNVTISSITWEKVSGPAVKFQDSTTYYGNGTATNYFKVGISSFWLQGLAPGNYVFKATGKSASGGTAFGTVALTVLPDRVCPVIPPIRSVTGISFTINGILFNLPMQGTKVTYNDGSTN